MFNKYNLNQFCILSNSFEFKKNKYYNLNTTNFNFNFKKKIMRSFLTFFFIVYFCFPFDYIVFLGDPILKLTIMNNITIFIDIKEYSFFL